MISIISMFAKEKPSKRVLNIFCNLRDHFKTKENNLRLQIKEIFLYQSGACQLLSDKKNDQILARCNMQTTSFPLRCCIYDIYCTLLPPQILYIWHQLYSPPPSEVGLQLFLSPNSLIFAAQAEREATNWTGDKKENRNLLLTLSVSVYVMCLLSSQTLRTKCTFHHNAFLDIWQLACVWKLHRVSVDLWKSDRKSNKCKLWLKLISCSCM